MSIIIKLFFFLQLVEFILSVIDKELHLKYLHDGSANRDDSFILQVSDGSHVTKKEVRVKVMPLQDEQPQVNICFGQGLYCSKSYSANLTNFYRG